MRLFIVFVCFAATCGFAYLAYSSKTPASYVAVVASFGVFLTSLANLKKSPPKEKTISQRIGNDSIGIQAGNDVNINKNKE